MNHLLNSTYANSSLLWAIISWHFLFIPYQTAMAELIGVGKAAWSLEPATRVFSSTQDYIEDLVANNLDLYVP